MGLNLCNMTGATSEAETASPSRVPEDEELGQPYDFEVGVVTEENKFTVYIEVKSTLSDTKEIFEISYPQGNKKMTF
jgi:hypothetical protein